MTHTAASLAAGVQGRDQERRVERWLRDLGHNPERYPPRRRRQTKTPDFQVIMADGDRFLCEVKSLAAAEPGFGALALKLVRARQQFDAVNHGGRLANVMVIAAREPPNLKRLIDAMRGREGGPLDDLDLVLGAPLDGPFVVTILHETLRTRHHSTLKRALPDLAGLNEDSRS